MPNSFQRQKWRLFLQHASRSKSFLWKLAIGTLLLAILLGSLFSQFRTPAPELFAERVLARAGLSLEQPDPDTIQDLGTPRPTLGLSEPIVEPFVDELGNLDLEFRDVVFAVPQLAPFLEPQDLEHVFSALVARFDERRAVFILNYIAARNSFSEAAYAALKSEAGQPNPPRYANYSLGEVEAHRRNFGAAFEAFRKEGLRPEANESRWRAVNVLLRAKDYTKLQSLRQDPSYAVHITPYVQVRLAALARDWRGLLVAIGKSQFGSYESSIVMLGLVAGCAWMFFLGHLGEWRSFWSSPLLLCIAAFFLGVLSTTVTVYLAVIEEEILQFTEGTEWLQILAYNIGGVALREEFSKLLLFLPLLPVLVRKDKELDAVIAASFVGLGFAVEENFGYFRDSQGASMFARFLSANFFHVALTGMNGLSFYRAVAGYRGGLNDFLYIFPLSILAHGLYNALPQLPGDDLVGFFSMTIYVGFTLFYFSRVAPLRENVRMTIGLTGAFVFALTLAIGAMIVYQVTNLGVKAGLMVAFPELLGSALLIFVFFRSFNEQLSE